MAARCGQHCWNCELFKEKICLGCRDQDVPVWGEQCPVRECTVNETCPDCPDYRCELHRKYAVRVQDDPDGGMITTYERFLERANEAGFMTLSENKYGLPSLSAETPEENWHTGDGATDPWLWRIRAVDRRELAFGCVIGGIRGFIAPRLYPVFYSHFRPQGRMEELWNQGEVPQHVWDMWQLFRAEDTLVSTDIRKALKGKFGVSKTDQAMRTLEAQFYITVSGARRKLNKQGLPYGWPAAVYSRVDSWADQGFGLADLPDPEAAYRILRALFIELGVKDEKILRKFRLQKRI